jgi:hypothetical protein
MWTREIVDRHLELRFLFLCSILKRLPLSIVRWGLYYPPLIAFSKMTLFRFAGVLIKSQAVYLQCG